jgi:hypothetical protein
MTDEKPETIRDDANRIYTFVRSWPSPLSKANLQLKPGERLVIETGKGFWASAPIRFIHQARAAGYLVAELENGEQHALGQKTNTRWYFPKEVLP